MSKGGNANALSKYFGMKISRQRIMEYERHPATVPPGFGHGFATIYRLPIDAINFAS